MKKDDKASISLKKVISVSIALLLFMGISVMAVNSKVNNVKIILSDGYEMEVLTTKEKVSDILNDNHIILLPNEEVIPGLESNISDNKTIRITTDKDLAVKVIETVVKSADVKAEDLIAKNYDNIVEKLVVEESTIPFETETKDVSTGNGDKKEVVTRNGVDGIKKTTYKVKFQNDVEISKTEISTETTKEPITKKVEIRDNQVVSRASVDRVAVQTAADAAVSGNELAARAAEMTPKIVTLRTTAYYNGSCDKAPGSAGYGITASGARTQAWCTLAAGRGYPFGTIVYIPSLSNMPNGGWFVVQDRGGAISNDRLDIYMNTLNECKNYGVKTVECYVYIP